MFKGENSTQVDLYIPLILACVCMKGFLSDFFQTLCDSGFGQTVHFDASLNDLDLHPKSQGYGKASCV